MADKPKRPARLDLKSAGSSSSRLVPIAATAVVVIFAVALVSYIVITQSQETNGRHPGRG